MALFGKKESIQAQSSAQAMPTSPLQPVEQVAAMKQQGYTNSQIIASLQRDGYSSSQIFDALNQVEMRMGTPIDGSASASYNDPSAGQGPASTGSAPFPEFQAPSPQPLASAPSYGQAGLAPMPRPNMSGMQSAIPLASDSSVEELVESVIDEKWNELVKDLNKIIDWKNASETRLTAIEQQFKDLKDQFDRLHSAIVGKINDYDKNIQDVGAEIKAMEKVFSKVLPAFTDNVSELSRITDKIRSVGGSGGSSSTMRR